jgi:hypothetical protein
MNQSTGKLTAMAQRALAAKQGGMASAATAHEGSHISPDAIEAMKDFARVDNETSDMLALLEGARKDINEDPFARRAWLRQLIADYGSEASPGGEKFVALTFAALAQTLKNGQMALPLFNIVKLDELKGRPVSMILPRGRRENGVISSRGVMALVPATAEDEPALRILRSTRHKAAESLVEELEGETLVDPRKALWPALYLMEGAGMWTKTKAEEVFEDGEADLFKRKKDGKKFSYYLHSDKEIFVVEHSELAERLMKQLGVLSGFAKRFWAGEVNIEQMIKDALLTNANYIISADAFCRGQPGLVAVHLKAWKPRRDRNETVPVTILFDRPQGRVEWRWVMANPEAVRALFGRGRLAFHDWTRGEMPGFLQVMLRKGEPLTA